MKFHSNYSIINRIVHTQKTLGFPIVWNALLKTRNFPSMQRSAQTYGEAFALSPLNLLRIH